MPLSSIVQQQLHHHHNHVSPSKKTKQARRTLTTPSSSSSATKKIALRYAAPLGFGILIFSYALLVLPLHWRIKNDDGSNNNNNSDGSSSSGKQQQDLADTRNKIRLATQQRKVPEGSRCAFNFYGLPRSFKSLVLPSLVKNVIIPNAKYNCDYYIHYYDQSTEPAGRSGHGGHIDASEILLLKNQVELAASSNSKRKPTVLYAKESEDAFWQKYEKLVDKVRNTKDHNDQYLYFPWKAKTYQYPMTTDNILKMWHSIESSWNLMVGAAANASFKQYDRVAMMRSDAVYVTPIDIWDDGLGNVDSNNRYAVVPGFGKHPVSDRLIYGPYSAVKIWAASRFSNLDRHAVFILQKMPGWGLHSERFLKYTLFPAMLKQKGGGPASNDNVVIQEHSTMCFFRARADETMWVSDCDANGGDVNVSLPSIINGIGGPDHPNLQAVVEKVLGRKCSNVSTLKHPRVDSLDCST